LNRGKAGSLDEGDVTASAQGAVTASRRADEEDEAAADGGPATAWWRRALPYAGALLVLLLFAAAAIILYHQVTAYRPEDVRRALRALGWDQVAAAVALAAASYLLLTLYDVLALHHVGWKLRYRRVALTAFVGYAFSHAFGFGSIVGTSVRFRLYAPYGLTAGEIAEVSAFVNVTFLTGLAAAFPLVAWLDPAGLQAVGVPAALGFAVAAAAALATGIYVLLGWWLDRPLHVYRYELDLPRPPTAVAQLVLSIADLTLATAVLFTCLPWGAVSFPHLLGIYVLALVAGLITHVPGGLGVFDTIVLVGLSDRLPGDAVLAGLLVFRVVYYLLPVIGAGLLLGAVEALAAQRHLRRASQNLVAFVGPAAPSVIAGATFLGGVVLLFSSAAPVDAVRLWFVGTLLPLPVVEASHFLGSVVGVLLLLLARGLQRRLRTAWTLAAALLALGGISSVLKGFEWDEAAVLGLLLLMLLPARREFNRTSSLLAERLTPGWFLAIATALLSAFWLGLFCYKHVQFTDELWWRFALYGDASRFLRASVAVAVIALAAAVFRLLQPIARRREPPPRGRAGEEPRRPLRQQAR
jgi:phosphatidylglycerol lysyltransferase